MWPFKKNKVIDLTESSVNVPRPSVKEEEYKDLTPVNSDNQEGSALGFLSSMAGAASSTASSDFSSPATSSLSSPHHLKTRIEDIDYKINSLRNRIDKILERLDLAEKKIDRRDRR